MSNVSIAVPAALPPENQHRIYAQELRKRLPPHYFQPVLYRALWIIPFWGVAAAGIALIATTPLPLPVRLGVSLIIGLAFGSLGFSGHEILHGAVTRKPWLRDFLGGICMLPSGIAPAHWRRWHNGEHHGNTQVHGRDPDAYSSIEEYHERLALRILHRLVPVKSILFFALLSVWLSVHALITLGQALRKATWRERLILGAETLVPILLWFGLGLKLGWGNFVLFFAIPALIGNFVVMAYIATNHLLNPLSEEGDDPLAESLTVTVPKFLNVIHSNFSYHTEHHIFPGMSPKYAPHVKRLIKELWPGQYHEMPLWRALATLWRTPRLYEGHDRLIDPATLAKYGVLGRGLDPNDVRPIG